MIRMNIVKERAHRILTTDPMYRAEEVTYLRSVLKGIDQEDLIRHLKTLNYPELKAVVSCGIPGYAQGHALLMLKEKRDKLDAYVSDGGLEANLEVDVDVEEDKDEYTSEGIQSSKKGRERDSETLGDEDPDSGTS